MVNAPPPTARAGRFRGATQSAAAAVRGGFFLTAKGSAAGVYATAAMRSAFSRADRSARRNPPRRSTPRAFIAMDGLVVVMNAQVPLSDDLRRIDELFVASFAASPGGLCGSAGAVELVDGGVVHLHFLTVRFARRVCGGLPPAVLMLTKRSLRMPCPSCRLGARSSQGRRRRQATRVLAVSCPSLDCHRRTPRSALVMLAFVAVALKVASGR